MPSKPMHADTHCTVVFEALQVWDTGEVIDMVVPAPALAAVMDDTGLMQQAQHHAHAHGHTAIHIDSRGLTLAPGLCDPHVHFRDPGQRDKEDMLSGCRSAAAGGFTTVLLMPNTAPAMDGKTIMQQPDMVNAADDAHGVREIRQAGFESVIDYVQHYAQAYHVTLPAKYLLSVCATVGRAGIEATNPDDWNQYLRSSANNAMDMARKTHPIVGISDDGSAVSSSTLDTVACHARRYALPILDHCEHHDSGVMNEGTTSAHLGLPGIPASTELNIVLRDIALARRTGTHIHLQHVSTAQAFDAIRAAKDEGIPVTCETAAHYLALCDEDVERFGTMAKMNPPLRSAADRDATVAAVADGTVDMLATDHAPHTMPEKNQGMMKSPNGIIGLETAYGVCHKILVDGGIIDDKRLIELMAIAPAKLMGVQSPGISQLLDRCSTAIIGNKQRRTLDLSGVEDPECLDFTILDTRCAWTIESARFHSKARNTPFEAMHVTGRAQATILASRIAFNRIHTDRLMTSDDFDDDANASQRC